MSKAISARPRNRNYDVPILDSFRTAAITPILESKVADLRSIPVIEKPPLVEVKVPNLPVKNESSDISIYIPTLFHINWERTREILKVNLLKLTKTPPSYSYIKDIETNEDIIYYFNSSVQTKGDANSNYADGFNIKDNSDTNKYRLRGLYKIGYRYIKQETVFIATSFFIELVSNISKPNDYITYSICEDNDFSYSEITTCDTEVDSSAMDMFKLMLNYTDNNKNSNFKTLSWKGPILSGNTEVPCLDIPYLEGSSHTVSALVTSSKSYKIDVDFDTYLAYEARGNSLFIYTYNPISSNVDVSSIGGIYSMLNEKNKRIIVSNENSLPFTLCAEFPLNTETNLPTALTSDKIFNMLFISRSNGRYTGSNFLLPFELTKNDSSQISSYSMDDADKHLIWSTFLFLTNIPSTTEKIFPLDAKVKWTTEKLTDDATFTAPGVISYTKNKTFKSVSGDMTKFFCKNHTLDFSGPKNIHIIKVSLNLNLPDN
jgi:hypothetical protein